jgi:anhydro-N-acetylmuramic acid kinase
MSGTSADGIDVAWVDIRGRGLRLRAKLRDFCTVAYPAALRHTILRVANSNRTPGLSVAEISQLNFLLGELFARAVRRACRRFRLSLKKVDLIGSHGQTVYHQGRPGRLAGLRVASTLQLGEPAVIAERTGRPVVANFRPRDIAAGGQGAPLVPLVDYLLYRHPSRGRLILNLGGIANLTVIPAGASLIEVFGFDTGPGNMVIDALAARLGRGRFRFDPDGSLARRGQVVEPVLAELLRHPYFRRRPPKTTGREEFGEHFANQLWQRASRASGRDKLRTATELTVRSIAAALDRFVLPRTKVQEVILGGGGARNRFLVTRLRETLPQLHFLPAEQFGVGEKAKEAFAFAVLAYLSWHGEPANLPRVTGATHPVILGTITPAPPRKERK